MCCRGKSEPKPGDPKVLRALDYLVTMYNTIHTADRCNTEAGHWINEAFVIRLWAVLEAHHIVDGVKKIDPTLPGASVVDLCRHLRQRFAHATGRIKGKDARRLDSKLREVFGLGDQSSIFVDRFILSKGDVLRPMHAQCRAYAEALLEKETAGGVQALKSYQVAKADSVTRGG